MNTEMRKKGWPKSYAAVDVVGKGLMNSILYCRVFKKTLNTGPMYKFQGFPVAYLESNHTEFRQNRV